MVRLLIFDLDGTLAYTLPSIHHAVSLALKKLGYPNRTLDDVATAIGSGARNLIRNLMPPDDAKDDAKIEELLSCYNEMYKKTYLEADRCYDGMADAVRELVRRGYTAAVLSNKREDYTVDIVSGLFEDGTISLVRGQTSLPIKPDPTVPLMIAAELGFDPSCAAFIGDSEVDVMTAKNARMMSVGCSWGYRPRAVLESCNADSVIDHPSQLLDIFK